MEITSEIKRELKRIVWDYAIDEETLVSIFQGDTHTFSLKKEKLYSRLLISTKWYRLLDLIGIEGVKELLTDEVINFIWIKDIREKFLYVKERLHGIS